MPYSATTAGRIMLATTEHRLAQTQTREEGFRSCLILYSSSRGRRDFRGFADQRSPEVQPRQKNEGQGASRSDHLAPRRSRSALMATLALWVSAQRAAAREARTRAALAASLKRPAPCGARGAGCGRGWERARWLQRGRGRSVRHGRRPRQEWPCARPAAFPSTGRPSTWI